MRFRLRFRRLSLEDTIQNALNSTPSALQTLNKQPKRLTVGASAVSALCAQVANASGKARAATALGNLAYNADNQVAIAAAGAIVPLVELARRGDAEGKKYAAAALKNLADNAENKVAIAAAEQDVRKNAHRKDEL